MKGKHDRQTRKQFIRQFYHGNRLAFAAAMIAVVLSAAGNLIISWLLQQVLDAASGTDGALALHTLVLITGILIVAVGLTGWMLYCTKPGFVTKAVEQYKNYAFGELTKKGIAAFSSENTSVYISALSNDVNSIEANYLSPVFTLVRYGIEFVGAFIMMLWYSPILTFVAAVLSCLPVLASILTGKRLAAAEKTVSDKNASYIATLKDSLSGFSVIKSFRAERQIIRIFRQSNKNVENSKCRRDKIKIVIQTIGEVAGISAQMGVFLFGAWLALTGRGITPGVVIIFVQLMGYVIQPIAEVPGLLANRKAAIALIDKLADAVSSNVRSQGQEVPGQLTKGITVKNLSFAYEDGRNVLHNINTCFELGKSYAIVGASGSGKTTLLNLLMAGHSDYDGQIFLDDTELRSISTESLYSLVSLVQQNVFVFNSSIRDNITMFHPFEQEEVERAVTLSGLDALIAARGEDYACGENGSALSGGEKQRISIARCLLRKNPVLLVDEATAALDAETAFYVTSSILDITGLTRIVVTHDLDEALLRKYDHILTLKGGSIVESGSFDALMAQKGYFYSLFTVSQA